MRLADLRRADVPGTDDLRAWRFRDTLVHDDTSTVLAWAGDEGCVLHEALCPHVPTTSGPTAMGRMDEARDLFIEERPKGTVHYFSFCGHCLIERVPNFGWEPTPDDLALLATMRQVLNDVRLLGHRPIIRAELTKRMARYGATVTPAQLKRLLDHERAHRAEDAPDLSAFVTTVAARS